MFVHIIVFSILLSSLLAEYLYHDFNTICIHNLDHCSFVTFIAHCYLFYTYLYLYFQISSTFLSSLIYFLIDYMCPFLKNFFPERICGKYIVIFLCLLIFFICFKIMIITILILQLNLGFLLGHSLLPSKSYKPYSMVFQQLVGQVRSLMSISFIQPPLFKKNLGGGSYVY